MNINGEEFEFDITDLNDSKRYMEALDRYQARIPEIQKAEGVDVFEKGIEAIRDFLYESTGHDVLYNCTSFKKAVEAFKSFVSQINKQKNEMMDIMDDIRTEAAELAKPSDSPKYPSTYRGMGNKRPVMVNATETGNKRPVM